MDLFLLVMSVFVYGLNARLKINHKDVDSYSVERIINEGEFVETIVSDHPTCPHVREKTEKYKFYVVDEDGKETEEFAKVQSVIDINYDTDRFCNNNETWICSNIMIRFLPLFHLRYVGKLKSWHC